MRRRHTCQVMVIRASRDGPGGGAGKGIAGVQSRSGGLARRSRCWKLISPSTG
jgi:hypothetical protein